MAATSHNFILAVLAHIDETFPLELVEEGKDAMSVLGE